MGGRWVELASRGARVPSFPLHSCFELTVDWKPYKDQKVLLTDQMAGCGLAD